MQILSFTGNHYLRTGGYEHIREHTWENHEGVWFYWLSGIKRKKINLFVRVFNWFYFNHQVIRFVKKLNTSPKAVILSSPPVTLARLIKPVKQRFNTKIIFEVRDLWPLSLVELGNYSPNNPFIKWLSRLEKEAYQQSDQIVGLIPGIKNYLAEKGYKQEANTKAHYIPQAYFDEDIPESTTKTVEYEIGFTGTLNKANELQTIFSALEHLANQKNYPRVLIIGTGIEASKVQQKVRHLSNVTFIKQWLDREAALSQLAKCRVGYNGLRDLSIYQYGIACVKWMDYWMLKKPILTSFSGEFYSIPIGSFGWQVPAEDPEALANQIRVIQQMNDQTFAEKGQRGFEFLMNNFHHQHIGDAYERVIAG